MTIYRETVITEVEAVHWTGDSIELARVVGAPVTVQPDGTATWPTPEADEDFGALPPGHVGVMFPDDDERGFEAIPVAEFTKRFKKVIGPRPKATPAAATPPPPSTPPSGE